MAEKSPVPDDVQEEHMDDDDPLKNLEDQAPKPHCMGHHFHWAEIAFALGIIAGLVMIIIGGMITKDLIITIFYMVYIAAGLTACALIFNLISIKRIAAASELLLQDVKKFRAQNNRAKELQEINKKNDAQMKSNLADLEKAGLLLKGSVQGLEDVQKEEEAMLQEREELLEQRREVAGKLEKNMDALWNLTIDAVRSEMEKRVMDVFADLAKPNADDEDGIVVGSNEWDELIKIIEEYGVEIDEHDTSEHGLKTIAGDDKFLNFDEFETWWGHAEKKHFEHLIEVLKRNRDLEDRIRSLELGLPEKEAPVAEDVLISV